MRLKALLGNVRVLRICADLRMQISGVTCNSEDVTPGDMFVAVKGNRVDGNDYISCAME